VTDDAWRRLLELFEERCHGIYILAVWYHLALELDAGVIAQGPLEVDAQRLLTLSAASYAHVHVRQSVTDDYPAPR